MRTITLLELEKLWSKHLSALDGKLHVVQHPMELSPAYPSYCRRNWTAWQENKQRRMQQLAELDMIETHLIDYYEDNDPITP